MDTQDLQRIKNKYDIVGNDAALADAIETAIAVAPTDITALITGESGVGKEVIPQIIHQHSRRKNGKYLAVNCGAIPSGTINAELFGHEKGAFTGALGERKGYFEEANGGTLFLDEVGELPRETQALLLRVLQNGEFMKVGSSKVEKTDVRVIAATNVNLAYAVATGKFREDLYYRLAGIHIFVPALRDRNKDDIYTLFRKFSSDFGDRFNLCKVSLTHDAISVLTGYRWPGNIRQLKNVAEAVTGVESRPVTPTVSRVEVNAATLLKYIPNEKDTLLPAAPSAPAGGSGQGVFGDIDPQKIVKALLDLSDEVKRLKAIVEGGDYPRKAAAASAAALPSYASDPDEQDGSFEHAPADIVETEPAPAPEEQQAAVTNIRKNNADLIDRVLADNGGNVKEAALKLGISERTIYRHLAKKKQG